MDLGILRKGTGVVAVERASSWMRVVELRRTRTGVCVANFAVVEHLQDSDSFAAAQMFEVLKKKGIGAKAAVMALNGEGVAIRLLPLPHLRKRELKTVVEQEIRLESRALLDEISYDYRSLGDVQEGAVSHNLVLLAQAPMAKAAYAFDFAEKCGLRLTALIPLPLALAALLRLLEPARTSALLYLTHNGGHLVVTSQGQYRFHREIVLDGFHADGQDGVNLESLTDEIKRSLLYVSQRFRGEKIEVLQLCGEGSLQTLAQTLSPALGLPVEPCDPAGLLDLTELGEEQQTFRAMVPRFAVPIGLALAEGEVPNLLPARLVRRRRATTRLVSGAVAAGLLILVMLLGLTTVSAHNAAVKEGVATLERELADLRPRLMELEHIKKERQYYKARSLFLERTERHAGFFAGLLDALAAKTPEAATLHMIEITRGAAGWQMRVDGEVRAKDVAAALVILDEFYKEARRLPFLVNPEVKLTEEPKPQGDQKGGAPPGKAGFHITTALSLKELVACGPFGGKASP